MYVALKIVLIVLSVNLSKNKLCMCKYSFSICILESMYIPEPSGCASASHNLALSNLYALCSTWSSLFCFCFKSVTERIYIWHLFVLLIHSSSHYLYHNYQMPGANLSNGITKNGRCLCRTTHPSFVFRFLSYAFALPHSLFCWLFQLLSYSTMRSWELWNVMKNMTLVLEVPSK